MKFREILLEGKILKRVNRFSVLVQIEGRTESAHLANSGRLAELMVPGYPALLAYAESPNRKTRYDLRLIRTEAGIWVSADARMPNQLFHEAFLSRMLKPFIKMQSIQPEVRYGKNRLDFQLTSKTESCFVEVKSVTLVNDRKGLFPDAPTERGRKHLDALLQIKGEGYRSAVVFVVQRQDADAVSPNDTADAEFGKTLRNAFNHGIEIYAYRCSVNPSEIRIQSEIPVQLS